MPLAGRHPRGPIRVLLAEDDPVFLAAARGAITAGPGIEVVASLADGSHVVTALLQQQVDVLVMDLTMPGGGPELVRAARKASPRLGVLVLSGQDDPHTCLEVLLAGATCVVSKHGIEVDLHRCVLRCHRGDVLLVGAGPAQTLGLLLQGALGLGGADAPGTGGS